MSGLMEHLKNRRSVRKFEDTPVSQEQLDQILEAVRWSPSWANTQCWEIVVVKDPEQRQKLQETMGKGNPSTKAIVTAPLLLAVCGKLESSGYYKEKVTTKFGDWFMFDLGIATQSISLACEALGLGSVVVGLFDQQKAAEVVKLPQGYELVTLMPIGVPAQDPKPPKRREIAEFIHTDVF
ncbi:nitroreductase family protein [Dethiosulfatarculus sandiegensis]|uniref:Nitroreductase n=1 Tax=Dethiosulfatarculus sandiegensis TaxID=1429043 RepID=A0A0D2J6M3_9BACT|nr:nitroreductase family protein [Dethiosulfatarculus sandiegensis]KIX13814.1 nitroreductase [Dethiosulfatarculus sandiegensis]